MSIPKEKTIIENIKDWKSKLEQRKISLETFYHAVAYEVNSYEDPGYIGGPIVGEAETEENGQE